MSIKNSKMRIKSAKSNNKTMLQTVIQRLMYIEEECEGTDIFFDEQEKKMTTELIRQTERVEPMKASLTQNESTRPSSTRA